MLGAGNTFSSSETVKALDYLGYLAHAHGYRVASSNHSYGGITTSTYSGSYSRRAAIVRNREYGILFVAAAGNNGKLIGTVGDTYTHNFFPSSQNVSDYPNVGDYDSVVAVAAGTRNDGRAGFSNYGPEVVDLAAPGDGILSTVKHGGYGGLRGTSMASPTFDNAPSVSGDLVTWSVDALGEYWVPLQNFATVIADGQLSLRIAQDVGSLNKYYSKDHGTVGLRPRLIVAYNDSDPGNLPPVINELSAGPSLVMGHTTNLIVDATDPEGQSLTYTWSVSPSTHLEVQPVANPVLTFSKSGTYSVSVEVSDPFGAQASAGPIEVIVQQTATVIDVEPY